MCSCQVHVIPGSGLAETWPPSAKLGVHVPDKARSRSHTSQRPKPAAEPNSPRISCAADASASIMAASMPADERLQGPRGTCAGACSELALCASCTAFNSSSFASFDTDPASGLLGRHTCLSPMSSTSCFAKAASRCAWTKIDVEALAKQLPQRSGLRLGVSGLGTLQRAHSDTQGGIRPSGSLPPSQSSAPEHAKLARMELTTGQPATYSYIDPAKHPCLPCTRRLLGLWRGCMRSASR